jgi:hypothetical protein
MKRFIKIWHPNIYIFPLKNSTVLLCNTHSSQTHIGHAHLVHLHIMYAHTTRTHAQQVNALHTHAMHCMFYLRTNSYITTVAKGPKLVEQQHAKSIFQRSHIKKKVGMSLKINSDVLTFANDTMAPCLCRQSVI